MSRSAFVDTLLAYADRAHDNDSYRAMVPEGVLRDAAYVIEEHRERLVALQAPSAEPGPLDAVYRDRNLVVQAFAAAMETLGWHVAWGVDEAEPDWPVLYIETEHGQVSWHIPKAERLYESPDRLASFGPMVWDGHTDETKFARLRAALAAPAEGETDG